jgi:hypothetical protein
VAFKINSDRRITLHLNRIARTWQFREGLCPTKLDDVSRALKGEFVFVRIAWGGGVFGSDE